MTVYQGEEVSIEVRQRISYTDEAIVQIACDDISVGMLFDIKWEDQAEFTKELLAVIEKYKI